MSALLTTMTVRRNIVSVQLVPTRTSAVARRNLAGKATALQGVLISRRLIQTTTASNEAEAYLEQPKPGISFLSLNRPKAKNAISLRLLKVCMCSMYSIPMVCCNHYAKWFRYFAGIQRMSRYSPIRQIVCPLLLDTNTSPVHVSNTNT